MENLTYYNSQKHFYAISLLDDHKGTTNAGFRQSELFELIWIKRGFATVTVDLESRFVSDNNFFCLVPGQINRFTVEDELIGYRIAFSQDFICGGTRLPYLPAAMDYVCRGGGLMVLSLCDEMQNEIETLIEMIVAEYSTRQSLWEEMLHGLLNALVGYIPPKREIVAPSQSGTDYLVFNRFMKLLDQKFTSQRQVGAYASDMAVSANYLSEIVKRVSGYSASHHIQQRVLLEAKRKAVSSDVSMKAIALELGFDDPSTFSKFFKSLTHMNFSDFRDCWLKEFSANSLAFASEYAC